MLSGIFATSFQLGDGLVQRQRAHWCKLRILNGCFSLFSIISVNAAAEQSDQSEPTKPADATVPAPVSNAEEGPSSGQAIIITGSRIPRRNLTAVSPVTMIKQDEIKLSGAILIEDIINQLPQVTPDQGSFISYGASGTATANLRNLGASRTLVLVNGRRLLPGDPTYVAADLNMIPSSIIQRVEVLTGGASSVYGSDAVSGVINFILDTRINGLRFDGQASAFQHNGNTRADIRSALSDAGIRFPTGSHVDGGSRDGNAAFGKVFLDGRAHVTIYGGYRSLSRLTQDSRDYSACTLIARPKANSRFCGGSLASAEGSFFTFFDSLHLGPDQTFLPGPTFFNYAPLNYYQRPDRRYTAGGFADFEINAAMQPYLEAMYMDDRTVAQIAPSGDFGSTFSVNCNNPLLSAQQISQICFKGNFIGETPVFDDNGTLIRVAGTPVLFVDPVTGGTYNRGFILVARRNVEGGPRRDDRSHKNLRLVGGLKGDIGHGVTYDASYVFGRVKLTEAYTNDVSLTRLTRSLDVVADPATGEPVCRSLLTGEDPNCVPWNVFKFNGVTPQAAAYITIPASQTGVVEQKIANASTTVALQQWGIISPWADAGPSINLGAEYRKDLLDFQPDAAFQSGDLAGQDQPIIPFKGTTAVKELFGEVRVPLLSHHLIEELIMEGGYRRSWHSQSNNRFTTDSYKIALDLAPVRGLRLRASQQRAVRAPNIQDLFAPQFPSFFDRDPCAGISPQASIEECARTGVSAAQYGNILANPLGENFGGYHAIAGGNPSLGPEIALTRAVGLVVNPRFVPGFNATVDWFDINLTGAIAEIGSQAIIDTCIATGDPLFCTLIHRDTNGTLWQTPEGYIDDRNANIGALNVRGIDFGANYSKPLGRFGSASLELLGTRLIKSVIDNGGQSTSYDCAGLYGYPCTYPLPRWRHTARFTWETRDGPAISIRWRRVGKVALAAAKPVFGLLDDVSPAETQIPTQNYFDVTGLVKLKRAYVLRLGIRNIFDRQPPLVTSGNPACNNSFCNGNTFPQLYDPLGRYFFAGVTLEL